MIGERIRKIRLIKDFSQEYMADRLKISQTAYSDIEHNKTKLNLERINDIAAVFGMKPDDVINFDEAKIFNNVFNENAKGFFNIKKLITDTFDHERKAYQEQINSMKESFDNERRTYQEQIQSLKDEVEYLRKLLGNKP